MSGSHKKYSLLMTAALLALAPLPGNAKITGNFSTGAIRVGAASDTCAAGTAGSIRYSSSKIQFCNGTTWGDVAAGGTANAAGTDGQVQYNNGGASMGADANLVWDYTNEILNVTGTLVIATDTITLAELYSSASTGSIFRGSVSGGTIASPTVTPAGTTSLVALEGQGHDGGGFMSAAFIDIASVGTPAANNVQGEIYFYTSPDNAPLKRMTINKDGLVGINTTPVVSLDMDVTDAIVLPLGTTAQRPTGGAGMIRYNSTIKGVEAYQGVTAGWSPFITNMRIVKPATASNYTVPANLIYAIIEVVGAGGSGGGSVATLGTAGGGGGAGGYIKVLCTQANLGGSGATQAVTIGNGGTSASGAGNPGSAATTFGASGTLLTGNVGSGGASGASASTSAAGGAGGTATSGGTCTTIMSATGQSGGPSTSTAAVATAFSGIGGSNPLGMGGGPVTVATGVAGTGFGSGGSGGATAAGPAAKSSGAGAAGIVIVTEYLAGAP